MVERLVVFKNSKKQRLVGILHIPNTKRKCPAVIICHGQPGDKAGTGYLHVRTARELCKKNFVVLRFDFSSMGDSEGNFEYMTHTQALDDLKNAIDFIMKIPNVNKSLIGLIGHSFGGEIAVMHSLKDSRIKVLALEAPRLDYRSSWSRTQITKALRKGYIEIQGLRLNAKNYFRDRIRYIPTERATEVHAPTLVIHGTNDKSIPYKDSVKFVKNLKVPKKLVLLKKSDHEFMSYLWRSRVISEIVKWLSLWL